MVAVIGRVHDEFELLYAREVDLVAGFSRASDHGGVKGFMSVGFDEKDYRAIGLMKRVQARHAAEFLPFSDEAENVPGRRVRIEAGGIRFAGVQERRKYHIVRWHPIGCGLEPANFSKLRLGIPQGKLGKRGGNIARSWFGAGFDRVQELACDGLCRCGRVGFFELPQRVLSSIEIVGGNRIRHRLQGQPKLSRAQIHITVRVDAEPELSFCYRAVDVAEHDPHGSVFAGRQIADFDSEPPLRIGHRSGGGSAITAIMDGIEIGHHAIEGR